MVSPLNEFESNSMLLKKKNEAVINARKFIKKEKNEKALHHYHKAFQIMPSVKVARAIVELEERIIRKLFSKEYNMINRSDSVPDGKTPISGISRSELSDAFRRVETYCRLWPKKKKLSSFIRHSQWKKADEIWTQEMACLLDPVLVGKYFLGKKEPWSAFLSWRFMWNLWNIPVRRPEKENAGHRHDSLTNVDFNCLATGLEQLAAMEDVFLLGGTELDLNGVQWLFEHLSKDAFKTIVYKHLRYLVYEGLWVRGDKFYGEIRDKYKEVSWTDSTGRAILLSLKFWKIFRGCRKSDNPGNTNQDALASMGKLFKEIGKAKILSCPDTASKKIMLNHLSEYIQAQWSFKDETDWTSVCVQNPYKLMRIEKRPDGQKMTCLLAQAIAKNGADLRKLLNVQRVLQNVRLRPVLNFLFFPI